MKMLVTTLFIAAAVSTPVFAQTAAQASPSMQTAQTAQAALSAAAAQPGQWVPPYGQPVAGKTRAEVYQELVQAEQDGQLDYLNSTVYAH